MNRFNILFFMNRFNIAVIGLKARSERWERCREILEGNGIRKVTRIMTVQDYRDPYRGYMRDFLKMLRAFRGAPLMFFEDDFELVEGWQEVFQKAVEDLPRDYDMLYLGCNLTEKAVRYTDNLARVHGAWLMHATLLSEAFIDDIIVHYPPANIRIIDEWYRKIAKTRKFYMTLPMISYQRADFSDFVNQYVYYDIFSNKHYANLKPNTRIPTPAE